MVRDNRSSEARRLESLWAGEFGDQYVERNRRLDARRAQFWEGIAARPGICSVLEVGCGQGGNLAPLVRLLEPADVWGIDVNPIALERARGNAPGANVVAGIARALPFRDGFVDLTFTMGVLIHQPDTTLPLVLAEIVRCSGRYVLWGEYTAEESTEIPYHGATGALIKRDYGRIYRELFPDLTLIDEGFLKPEDGFDRVTWQLLERGQ